VVFRSRLRMHVHVRPATPALTTAVRGCASAPCARERCGFSDTGATCTDPSAQLGVKETGAGDGHSVRRALSHTCVHSAAPREAFTADSQCTPNCNSSVCLSVWHRRVAARGETGRENAPGRLESDAPRTHVHVEYKRLSFDCRSVAAPNGAWVALSCSTIRHSLQSAAAPHTVACAQL